MLTELVEEGNCSDESVWSLQLSFDIETRESTDGEIIHRTYTFNWAKGFDKWTLTEFSEERTPDTTRMGERDWKQSRHIRWSEMDEMADIDVPTAVADALAEATGAGSVTVQVPAGTVSNEYEEVYVTDE